MGRQSKQWVAACVLVLMCLLTACGENALTGHNVEELLRAPQLSGTQSAVQRALNEYLGETLQLKYPRDGEIAEPIVFADFDDDGQAEAAVLYTTEAAAKTVRIAILEQRGEKWSVSCEAEGLGTEVAQLELVSVKPQGVQLAVGYANANLTEKYLAVYNYQGTQLRAMGTQAYEVFLIADLLQRGAQQLFFVPPSVQPGVMTLQVMRAVQQTLEPVQTISLDARFVRCTGLLPTYYAGQSGIVVAGELSQADIANDLLVEHNGVLTRWPLEREGEIVALSGRNTPQLKAQTMGEQSCVYIPKVNNANVYTADKQCTFVEWINYLAGGAIGQFGVYDAATGVYVRLPLRWRGRVQVRDGAVPGAWRICDAATQKTLLSVRIEPHETEVYGYRLLAMSAGSKAVALFSEDCTSTDRSLIERGVRFFQS